MKLKIQRKHLSAAIAFALILTIAAAFIICLPLAAAQIARKTTGYVSAIPKTVGIGKSVLISGWVVPPPDVPWIFLGFYFDITKPDGTKVTNGPYNTGGDGTAWATYVPDK